MKTPINRQNGTGSIDPVCGMAVDPETAGETSRYEGTTYHFCSLACKSKFDADPGRFVPESVSGREQEVPETSQGIFYICPMHPEVKQDSPGSCPKCGMALEPAGVPEAPGPTQWTCPMHPEVVRDAPGDCPICGMALEPRGVSIEEEENLELKQMSRRFKVSAALTLPVVVLAMGMYVPGEFQEVIGSWWLRPWAELFLATPVVLWGGWPFFVRGWQSIVHRSLNMFTLIALGVGAAYVYSLIATLFPAIFPASFREEGGAVGVYFEAATVIVTLVLLGQVLELKARSREDRRK